METIGERLKRSRELKGLSQQQLASEIGSTRSAIAQVEGGMTKSLNAVNLVKAAKVLSKNPIWLATGNGAEESLEVLAEAITALPPNAMDQTFDMLVYHIEKAPPAFIEQNRATSYVQMIERLKADMATKRSKAKK